MQTAVIWFAPDVGGRKYLWSFGNFCQTNDAITQKTAIFILAAVRTSNLIRLRVLCLTKKQSLTTLQYNYELNRSLGLVVPVIDEIRIR
jgi:hypothetical protein